MPLINQSPRSEVYVDTPGAAAAGWGTTNTAIRRYTTAQKNTGSAITYADSATLGASFTINTTGIYSIIMGDYRTGGASYFGPSLNATGTTAANALTYATGKRGGTNCPTGAQQYLTSWTGLLTAGDIIRPHGNGDADAADRFAFFSITLVSY